MDNRISFSMMPTILLTLAGRASQVKPALNVIVSNVPGSREQLYLEGAPLEAIYPLSVVTDGMGINVTVVSYRSKLCVAITSFTEGTNRFVDEEGAWLPGVYVPAYVRRYPFCAIPVQRGGQEPDFLICVDETALEESAAPLFDKDGH